MMTDDRTNDAGDQAADGPERPEEIVEELVKRALTGFGRSLVTAPAQYARLP